MAEKSKKAFLRIKVSQGHEVFDLGVILKGFINELWMSNILSLYLSQFKSYGEG